MECNIDLKKELEEIKAEGELVAKELKDTAEYRESLRLKAAEISGKAELISKLIKMQQSSKQLEELAKVKDDKDENDSD